LVQIRVQLPVVAMEGLSRCQIPGLSVR